MFQFTHPGRGATCSLVTYSPSTYSFNSRTPGGVRHSMTTEEMPVRCFNSRTPGGVRQHETYDEEADESVSIHAPREGCDE